ncbi:MAG: ribonuclease HII [Candidatus Aenigmarchaeota archaeon]|nr:ribonuclease HII [Candidatus Aenigmarchaeota archaeon]MDW8160304.1 ribonuclease HII [Candidatus Aenigmarchaeota archaeon]
MAKFLVGGIDEAGRGAVIGPMVIAGVVLEKKDQRVLKSIGVKDSKELTPKKREELYKQIESIAKNIVAIKIPACMITNYQSKKINLDRIEAMKMADIIKMLDAEKIYVDSIEQNSEKFEKMIKEHLGEKKCELVVKNYMDESVPVVSAASIVAKVERDREIEEIKKQVKYDFGVGYSHDERTIKFIEKILQTEEEPPRYLRLRWETVKEVAKRLMEENKKVKKWVLTEVLEQDSWQKKIKDFFLKKI